MPAVTFWTRQRSAAALLVFLALIAPAFGQDDAAIFNYMNNVVAPRALFYYLDYVPVVPEVVAYILRALPLVAQAVLYRLLPAAVMLLLTRQLYAVLARDRDAVQAGWLAVAIMLVLRAVEVNIWANLTFVITPMFLAAVLYLLDGHFDNRRYSPPALAGVALAAVSVPFGILLLPVLVVLIADGGDVARRRQQIVLAIAVVAGYVVFNARIVSTALSVADPGRIAAVFLHGLRTDSRFNNALVCASSLALVLLLADAIWRDRDRASRLLVACLAIVGLGSVLGVLASNRLIASDGGFGAAHLLPVLVAALVAAGRAVLSLSDRARRAALVGVFVGIAGTMVVPEVGLRLRGPLELSLMKYRFLMVAEAFRQDCRDDEAMVFEEDDTAPVVLCRPQALAEGRHYPSNFVPTIGSRDPEAVLEDLPAIVVGRPVFP